MSTGRKPLEIVLSEEPDWDQFDDMVIRLLDHFDARVLEARDGLDERFWELEISDRRVTLDLRQSLGIVLLAAEPEARETARELADFLKGSLSALRSPYK